mgnify:CR=1 FL=1
MLDPHDRPDDEGEALIRKVEARVAAWDADGDATYRELAEELVALLFQQQQHPT